MKTNRILCLMLCITMIVGCFGSLTASAVSIRDEAIVTFPPDDRLTVSISQNEKNAIIDILQFVALDKGAVGLENADFHALRIGNKINRYVLVENAFQLTGYSYPIIYNNKVVLVATTSGDGQFQITTYEAEAIEKSLMGSVAFVYDAYGMYLYDGNKLELVNRGTERIEGRGILQFDANSEAPSMRTATITHDSLSGVVTATDLSVSVNLGYSAPQNSVMSAIDGYYAATVDFVSQNGKDICWAACVAMVYNYLNSGPNYTAEEIAIDCLGEQNMENGLDLGAVGLLMSGQSMGGVYLCDQDYMYHAYTLDDDTIVDNLDEYYPIVAGFVRTGGVQGYHTGVIDAIHTTAGYIRICDPNIGRIYSYRDTVNEFQSYYGEYTYTNPVAETFYYMNEVVSARPEPNN